MGICANVRGWGSLEQSCVLCGEGSKFCICRQCQAEFTHQQNRCRSCACPINGKLDFCGQCLTHAPVFNRAYALYDYQGVIADLIKGFKYNNQLCVGAYFAHQLHRLYQSINPNYDVIIPMPPSKQRFKTRGYNQVLELLRVIRKQESVIIDVKHCQRIKATQSLSTLKLEQRQREIKGAFAVSAMPYQRILLVDDVMTTGASMNELAKTIIKSAKVECCDVMSLARA